MWDSPELALGLESRGEGNSIVEGETERIVGDVVALSTVEQVLLEVVADRKERAAGRIDSAVDAIGAQRTLGDGSWGQAGC